MGIPRDTARLLLDETRREPFRGCLLDFRRMAVHHLHGLGRFAFDGDIVQIWGGGPRLPCAFPATTAALASGSPDPLREPWLPVGVRRYRGG